MNMGHLPTAMITGGTLAFLANNYSGSEHEELGKLITKLLEEFERLRRQEQYTVELNNQHEQLRKEISCLLHGNDELTRLYHQTMTNNVEWQKKYTELREELNLANARVEGYKNDLKFCVEREVMEKTRHYNEMQQFSKTWIAQVVAERVQQDEKYGLQGHSDYHWQTILAEEFGELARAVLESGNREKELVHVAAVAVAWLECLGWRKSNELEKTSGSE